MAPLEQARRKVTIAEPTRFLSLTAKIALVEIIRQLVQAGKRILVCGASNLAVGNYSKLLAPVITNISLLDNLVERLSLHQVKLTRLGHPARIMHSLHANTLDYQVSQSDASAIAKDVKKEVRFFHHIFFSRALILKTRSKD